MTMLWRRYQWGDREKLGLPPIKTELIPTSFTLIDTEFNEVRAVAGMIRITEGTYEGWVDVIGNHASFDEFKALRWLVNNSWTWEGVIRLVAYIDPERPGAEGLARSVGFKKEAVLPRWYDGKTRILMGRYHDE